MNGETMFGVAQTFEMISGPSAFLPLQGPGLEMHTDGIDTSIPIPYRYQSRHKILFLRRPSWGDLALREDASSEQHSEEVILGHALGSKSLSGCFCRYASNRSTSDAASSRAQCLS